MGDDSDAPAYLTAIGVSLLVGALWAAFVPFDGLRMPISAVAAAALATALFAIGAAVKASDRKRPPSPSPITPAQ